MLLQMKRNLTITILILFLIASNLSFSQCVDAGNVWNNSWTSCTTSQNPNSIRGNSHWFMYEFTQAESIDSTHIWNANKVGNSHLGAKEVFIDYSTDGINWQQLGLSTFPKANESANYSGFNGPNFNGVFVKKILFTVLSNHNPANNNCVSLAEVQFKVNEDACYGSFDVCGVCNGPGMLQWFRDGDRDGLGNADNSQFACTKPNGYVANSDDECDNGIVGWSDVATIFSANGCTGCHGNNATAGLNLLTYNGVTTGGNNCSDAILTGTVLVDIIETSNYNGCEGNIVGPSMNDRVGGQIDNNEIALIQQWIDGGVLEDCNCPLGSTDTDNDGVCNNSDNCPNFNNQLIGVSCNDGNPCTANDVYTANCKCEGTAKADFDLDGICDDEDAAPSNPCTADGTIDGSEPQGWRALNSADCDNDGVSSLAGDKNDFSLCINEFGATKHTVCNCSNNILTGGLEYVGSVDVTNSGFGIGMPNGTTTGNLTPSGRLILSVPYLSYGEEICISLGFNHAAGVAAIDINGYLYSFPNYINDANYVLQELCVPVITEGEQIVTIADSGTGQVRVDGAYYQYCACTPSDVNYDWLSCMCPLGQDATTTNVWKATGFNQIQNTNGFPDNIFGGTMSGAGDSLIYQLSNQSIGTEICVALAFNNGLGKAKITLNEEAKEFYNTGAPLNEAIEFCYPVFEDGLQTLLVQDDGSGQIFVDGITVKSCKCPTTETIYSNSAVASGNYQVSSFIESNGIIQSGNQVIYKAGKYIDLLNDFEVKQGATFEAQIEDCQ